MGCHESRKTSDNFGQQTGKNSQKVQFEVYAALKQNNFAKVKDLIPKKLGVNYKMPYFMGKTALHIAAEFGDRKMIALLLSCGADENSLDISGCPPVYAAMRNGNLEAVNAILEIGSKVDTDIVTNHNLQFHDFITQNKYKESLAILKKYKYNKLKY